MGKRSHQAKAYHKQRKAKARAQHQSQFRSWIDRKKASPKPRPSLMPFAGAAMSLAGMEAMFEQWERQDEAGSYVIRFGDHSHHRRP